LGLHFFKTRFAKRATLIGTRCFRDREAVFFLKTYFLFGNRRRERSTKICIGYVGCHANGNPRDLMEKIHCELNPSSVLKFEDSHALIVCPNSGPSFSQANFGRITKEQCIESEEASLGAKNADGLIALCSDPPGGGEREYSCG